MSRTEKKCILASVVLHGLLLAVIVFGAAFKGKPEPIPHQRVNLVPARLIDAALAGGGGNPDLMRTDDQIKGETLTPQPPAAPTPPVPPAAQLQPTPPTPTPQPRTEPRRNEPRVEPQKKPDIAKPAPTSKPPIPQPLPLVPYVRDNNAKAKAKAEAEARAAREAERKDAAYRRELAARIGKTTEGLRAGFEKGTAVDVGGPGGEAYASYSAFVRAAYDDAWRPLPDLASQDHVAAVEVVVERTGRILRARIISRSGNAPMDKSVQNALDAVKKLPPFPEGARDPERTFKIEFNLKDRRHVG